MPAGLSDKGHLCPDTPNPIADIVTRTAKPRVARKLVDGKYVKYILYPQLGEDLIKSKMRIEKNKERGVFASLLLYSPFYAHMASHWENREWPGSW